MYCDPFDPADVAVFIKWFKNAEFDALPLMAGSMGLTAVAGGISAAGTLAGGSYAKQAADYQAG